MLRVRDDRADWRRHVRRRNQQRTRSACSPLISGPPDSRQRQGRSALRIRGQITATPLANSWPVTRPTTQVLPSSSSCSNRAAATVPSTTLRSLGTFIESAMAVERGRQLRRGRPRGKGCLSEESRGHDGPAKTYKRETERD
jgi:hypothetical protein